MTDLLSAASNEDVTTLSWIAISIIILIFITPLIIMYIKILEEGQNLFDALLNRDYAELSRIRSKAWQRITLMLVDAKVHTKDKVKEVCSDVKIFIC